MRLKDERHSLYCGGVSTLPALHQPLLNELLGISKQRNALTRGAFPAKIVVQAFAVGRLREHACQRKFADAPRPGKEQCMRHAAAAERAAQRRNDSFITKELREAHGLAPILHR